MDRRVLLVSLATLGAGSALAQSSPPPPTDAPAAPAPDAPAAAPAPAPAMKIDTPVGLSDAVTQYMARTMAAGSLSLAASRIAAMKAKGPMIRQFAGFEIAEQETVADILKGMMMPDLKPTGEVKGPTDADIAGKLDPKGKALLEKMRAMKAGPDFDREYLRAQVDGHTELLAVQEAYLKTADDAGHTNLAKLARGMIKEHLALLADLQKKPG